MKALILLIKRIVISQSLAKRIVINLSQPGVKPRRVPGSFLLDVFFEPKTVALIGATETVGSVGRTILKNLIASPFGGTVYPVNPKRPNVLGIRAYPTVSAIPEKVDLAVIVTPATAVPAGA